MRGAGLHARLVSVCRPARSPDGEGGFTKTSASIGSWMGVIRPAGSNEQYTAQQRGATVTHVVYFRTNADVDYNDLLVVDSLSLRVTGVRRPAYANDQIECDCVELQGE